SAVGGRRSVLENDELRVELDDSGEIASLYDKRADRETIAPRATGNQLVAYEDRPMQWDAWDVDIFYEEKPYPVREIVDWRVVEQGPLRAAVEITRRLGQSTIRQRICLWRGSRRVDFATEVDWQERQTLLRALFPLNVNATRATCEIQFGAVERPTHRNTSWDWARFEVCAHRWVDLSEGDYGVALLNDGKYGHSLHHNILGLSLLKGAIFPDRQADRGLHRFTYSLLPHAGDWRAAGVVRRAYELNAPLRAVERSNVQTFERSNRSFLSTPTDHIVVETLKVADDGNGLIVRLYEAHNQRGPASLKFGRPVAAAVETDLLEREVGPVEVDGDEVRFQVRPFEVKTLRVRLT
ncbi:MAG TPA: glycoside hydrolase family 38 C-terminal domain-containing protein, partial [Roseiflexaceae bacterium]